MFFLVALKYQPIYFWTVSRTQQSHLNILLASQPLHFVHEIIKLQFRIQSVGPVLHLLHDYTQIFCLIWETWRNDTQDNYDNVSLTLLLVFDRGLLATPTSCPLPLNLTLPNRVRRAGSPLSEVSLELKELKNYKRAYLIRSNKLVTNHLQGLIFNS